MQGGVISARIREYCARTGNEPVASADAPFDREEWHALAALGLQRTLIPKDYGGEPAPIEDLACALIELGRARQPLGLCFSLGAHLLACTTMLVKYGTPEQKRRWLPRMGAGDCIAAIAVAEPDGGSDAFALQTKAQPRADGAYVLNGAKTYITNATVCDVALVFAQEAGSGRVLCMLVPKETSGFTTTPIATAGLAGSALGSLTLRDALVAPEMILGSGTKAKMLFMRAMEWERGLILAPTLGIMTAQISECVAWLAARNRKDTRLIDVQALRHRLAEMQQRCYLAELALADFVRRKSAGMRAFREASLVKWTVADAFLKNSLDALTLYGAYGYTLGARAQQDVRDALAFTAASGTTDVQKNIVADFLEQYGNAHNP